MTEIEKTVLKMPINDFFELVVFRLFKDKTVRDCDVIFLIRAFQSIGYLQAPCYDYKVIDFIDNDFDGNLACLVSGFYNNIVIDLNNGRSNVIS